MAGVPFDPQLMDQFLEAAKTSTARMEAGTMSDWLALRYGVDASGLIVYAEHYAAVVLDGIGPRLVDADEVLRNVFVCGFAIALELVSGREASRS